MTDATASKAEILPARREIAIDYFKSYLVVGMILAHTISLLYPLNNTFTAKLLHAIAAVINLISFPGFFFCFGYVNYKSYFSKEYRMVKENLIANAVRILIAYYLSAFASAIFLSGYNFTFVRTLKILSFTEMPAYSEFLIAFFLITLLSLLLFNVFKRAINKGWVLMMFIIVSAASTFIPYNQITSNQIGLFIGTNNFAAFPVLQYLCYFLLGILFAKKRLRHNWWMFILSAFITLPFVTYIYLTHHLPSRFPPDIFWITGSAFLLYLYYLLSHRSELWFGRINFFLSIGRQTLFYLLLSNLLLFALATKVKNGLVINGVTAGAMFLSIMLIIYYLSNQVSRISYDRTVSQQ